MRFILDDLTIRARQWMVFTNSPDDTVRRHMARIDRRLDDALLTYETLCREADREAANGCSYGNRLCLARMLYQLTWQIRNLSSALVTLHCSYPNDISDDDLHITTIPTFLAFDPLETGYRQRIDALEASGALKADDRSLLQYHTRVLEDTLTIQCVRLTLTGQELGDLRFAEEILRNLEAKARTHPNKEMAA